MTSFLERSAQELLEHTEVISLRDGRIFTHESVTPERLRDIAATLLGTAAERELTDQREPGDDDAQLDRA